MSTVALIDADIVAFQLSATAQRTYRWPGLEKASVAADDFANLPHRVEAEIDKLANMAKADHVVICLSCPTEENWRLGVLPTYKATRNYTERPVHLAAVKDYLAEHYPSYRKDTLEADDIMGILSTMPKLPSSLNMTATKRVIVSEDKDMKTIPGWLLNPRKDKAPWLVDEATADRWHLYQTLVGDATDNYAGCPGIGPIKADKLLAMNPTWGAVVDTFVARGLTEQDALVQARVARICRDTEYDFKAKAVRLWTPNID